jgi:hypothetical protein
MCAFLESFVPLSRALPMVACCLSDLCSLTKYQTASTILGQVVAKLVPQIDESKSILELCIEYVCSFRTLSCLQPGSGGVGEWRRQAFADHSWSDLSSSLPFRLLLGATV